MMRTTISLLVVFLHCIFAAPSVNNFATGICPDGSLPVNCLVNPCKTASCPAVADATCVADYCGGCNARWILNGQEVTDQCHGCSDGSLPVTCLINPCKQASCPSINGATCVSNYCGGCKAEWFLNGHNVTDQCQGCDDGSTPVQCLKNPCQVSSCPSVADARCVVDYCGGCNARWILNGQDVTNQCLGLCPDGSSPVNCLVNPCDTAICPGVGGATCVADYCGGCNARWILNGQEVTDQCHGCADGSLPVNCLIDPCQVNSCPLFPTTTCEADYCGGCNATFYMNDVEVTHACGSGKFQ